MVDLNELNPQPCWFVVSRGWFNKVLLEVRPFTLADDSWLQNRFTETEIAHMFESKHGEVFAAVLWHQLTPDAQRRLDKSVKAKQYNQETGKLEQISLDGEKKVMHILSSPKDRLKAMQALSKARGVSAMVGTGSKKKGIIRRIGAAFLTLWPRSMGGR